MPLEEDEVDIITLQHLKDTAESLLTSANEIMALIRGIEAKRVFRTYAPPPAPTARPLQPPPHSKGLPPAIEGRFTICARHVKGAIDALLRGH